MSDDIRNCIAKAKPGEWVEVTAEELEYLRRVVYMEKPVKFFGVEEKIDEILARLDRLERAQNQVNGCTCIPVGRRHVIHSDHCPVHGRMEKSHHSLNVGYSRGSDPSM